MVRLAERVRLPLRATLAVCVVCVVGVVGVAAAVRQPQPDSRPVSAAEARAAVQRVVDLTADGRFDEVCEQAHAQCAGLSGSGARSAYAPDSRRPPRVRCTFALPAHLRQTAWGHGHVVVLEGRDARDRPYVSQQLVVREGTGDDAVVRVHEPAFWRGIAYRGFGGVRGSVWSAAYGEGDTDPAFTAVQRARADRSCDDTAGYLTEVAPA